MAYGSDIDFKQIVPRCGGKTEAFEELCCQLAGRTLPEGTPFERIRGAGGDGGVECFADPPSGGRVGWQAKYVFDIDALLTQLTKSLTTALRIHPSLTSYVVCFPFDPTGTTGRKGKTELDKFEEWEEQQVEAATADGRQLTIERWPAGKLLSLFLDYDSAGGIREFFFNATVLSEEWFANHLEAAKGHAGPRYTPELNVQTPLSSWFAAFGRTSSWADELKNRLRACKQAHEHFALGIDRPESDSTHPGWPEDSVEEARDLNDKLNGLVDECAALTETEVHEEYGHCLDALEDTLARLASLESNLAADLEAKHGSGKADSPGFRQFMAEYNVSFPAANLDHTREAIEAFGDLRNWLVSGACSPAFEHAFILSGVAGSGKTHGVCDVATQRLPDGRLTSVAFGHQFKGEPNPWTRLAEELGLPLTLGRDGVLDALNAAAEASGTLLVICVDAINETRPLSYWQDRLVSFAQAVRQRPFLRVCFTCRTPFLPYCLPDGHDLPVLEHEGFAGAEREACREFFGHFGLEPPIAPILSPEFANPLYLRLVCETLKARDLRRLPTGWHGLAPTIRAFLDEKEKQFAAEHETGIQADIVGGSLRALAQSIADSGEAGVPWSLAQQAISDARPQAASLQVLEWLVRSGLLVEDAPQVDDPLGGEGVVRPAFERLGDFLIAAELLRQAESEGLTVACEPGGMLYSFVNDPDAFAQNTGVLGALSILVPEKLPDIELASLAENETVRQALSSIALDSLPSRDPATFSLVSRELLIDALSTEGDAYAAMDAVLAVSWNPSMVDALWVDELLKQQPLAMRDSFWSGYLHEQYESGGSAKRTIEAAFEMPLDGCDEETAERWGTILGWFTAAADCRVRDWATRALVAVLISKKEVILPVLERLLECDDDAVRERVLLSAYAALIAVRDTEKVHEVAEALYSRFQAGPASFDNAIVRDHIRCIAELADFLGVLPDGVDPLMLSEPLGTSWPLSFPSDEAAESWGDLPKLAYSCKDDDFFRYSMSCLYPWEHAIPRGDMARWILQRIAEDFGYEGSGCESYDRHMLGTYGGGRSKPTWAERIGKKYQWIALFQLASRLHDHAERRHDSWSPDPSDAPLIFMEERKLDPTLQAINTDADRGTDAWWIRSSVNLQSGELLPDEEWVAKENDLPDLETLLAAIDREEQRWLLLVSYPAWTDRTEDSGRSDPYRHVWVHLQSYLVHRENSATAFECLHRRNFFGKWMPDGGSWLYGFAGEYPWATSFSTDAEEWQTEPFSGPKLPVPVAPTWTQLAVEWEYDATRPENVHMNVPARTFFSQGDLWWDCRDGYRIVDGRTVFRDPRITEDGPSSLIVDYDDLLRRLDSLKLSLIWTVLGEKWILGGRSDEPSPRRTFSQIARLKDDGSVEIGDRVSFDDYSQDAGPASVR